MAQRCPKKYVLRVCVKAFSDWQTVITQDCWQTVSCIKLRCPIDRHWRLCWDRRQDYYSFNINYFLKNCNQLCEKVGVVDSEHCYRGTLYNMRNAGLFAFLSPTVWVRDERTRHAVNTSYSYSTRMQAWTWHTACGLWSGWRLDVRPSATTQLPVVEAPTSPAS